MVFSLFPTKKASCAFSTDVATALNANVEGKNGEQKKGEVFLRYKAS